MRYVEALFLILVALMAGSGAPVRSESSSATPHPKSVSGSPARAVLPENVRAACDAVASLLRSFAGTRVERSVGPLDDPVGNAKRNGCLVKGRGTFAALYGSARPDDRLHTWFEEHAWKANNKYDDDGPDGTAFGYEKRKVLCLAHVDWDGGDDSDPNYVPEDWFEAAVGCAAKGSAVSGK